MNPWVTLGEEVKKASFFKSKGHLRGSFQFTGHFPQPLNPCLCPNRLRAISGAEPREGSEGRSIAVGDTTWAYQLVTQGQPRPPISFEHRASSENHLLGSFAGSTLEFVQSKGNQHPVPGFLGDSHLYTSTFYIHLLYCIVGECFEGSMITSRCQIREL